MTFEQGAGYIRVTDTGGEVTLDTREELFHVMTVLDGFHTIPARPSGGAYDPEIYSSTTTLGSVAAGCTHIIGFCKIVYDSGISRLPDGSWFMVGGTIVSYIKRYEGPSGTNGNYISSMQMLTFEVDGSNAVLSEETLMQDDFGGGTLAGMTITYKLFAGTFT